MRMVSGTTALAHRLRVRAAVGCGLGLVLLAGSAGATSAALGEPLVRVLLYRGPGPVQIQAGAGVDASFTVAAGKEGLVSNDLSVGDSLRIEGGGQIVVGDSRYRGAVVVRRSRKGLTVVNEVPLESYVASSVSSEVYTSWSDPVLRAQAVATRTYALHKMARRRRSAFDVTTDTSTQVYEGMDAVNPAVRRAVDDTRGEFLEHGGKPILAAFHSSSGGRTATAEEVWGKPLPYLVSVEVEGEEDSPHTYWRTALPDGTLRRALDTLGLRVGPVHEIRVVERSASGRVRRLWLEGALGSTFLEGRQMRSLLGEARVRSTVFEIREEGDGFVFVGTGNGHGVGMSQWGARAMARAGASYHKILAHFYPGTTLRSLGLPAKPVPTGAEQRQALGALGGAQ